MEFLRDRARVESNFEIWAEHAVTERFDKISRMLVVGVCFSYVFEYSRFNGPLHILRRCPGKGLYNNDSYNRIQWNVLVGINTKRNKCSITFVPSSIIELPDSAHAPEARPASQTTTPCRHSGV